MRNPQSNYSFRDHAATLGGRFGGQYIANDTVDIYSLPWGDGVSATVRLLPLRRPVDPANPSVIQWTPFRYSQDVNDVGDWLRAYPGVRNFGADAEGRGVTFLIRDPFDPTAPPLEESPPVVVYNAINRAVDAGQDQGGWARLIKGGQNRAPVISKAGQIYLAQCLVMQHKQEIYSTLPKGWDATTKPQLLAMTSSAGTALMNLTNAIKQDADPHSTDWGSVCVNGNLVGLGSGEGMYVTFYKSTDPDPRTRQAANVQQGTIRQANFSQAQQMLGAGGGARGGFASYAAVSDFGFMGMGADLSQYADALAARSIVWEQTLNFPTYEQQAAWISEKLPADVIMYAFQDRPEWISPRIRAAAAARTQQAGMMAPVGGFTAGFAAPLVGAVSQAAMVPPAIASWGPPAGGVLQPVVQQPQPEAQQLQQPEQLNTAGMVQPPMTQQPMLQQPVMQQPMQQAAVTAGLVATAPPVAVTQSNMATQPAAGFAPPMTAPPQAAGFAPVAAPLQNAVAAVSQPVMQQPSAPPAGAQVATQPAAPNRARAALEAATRIRTQQEAGAQG